MSLEVRLHRKTTSWTGLVSKNVCGACDCMFLQQPGCILSYERLIPLQRPPFYCFFFTRLALSCHLTLTLSKCGLRPTPLGRNLQSDKAAYMARKCLFRVANAVRNNCDPPGNSERKWARQPRAQERSTLLVGERRIWTCRDPTHKGKSQREPC